MIRYIIIEDEHYAYEELKRMMQVQRPDYELMGWAQSIEQAVLLIKQGNADLIIADICLADGSCFEVFEQVTTELPVIFTTAYDEYVLKAFKLNSVDYLLKPIEENELNEALCKFEKNVLVRPTSARYGNLMSTYLGDSGKKRFLIRIGDGFRYIETTDIAFFYSEDKAVYIHTLADRRYIVDYTLEQLEPMLNQRSFFRVSRNCIANIKTVVKVERLFGGRLHPTFKPACPQKVAVSRSRVAAFLEWLDDCNG